MKNGEMKRYGEYFTSQRPRFALSPKPPRRRSLTTVVKDLRRGGFGLRANLGRWDVKYSPYLFISPFFILFGLVGLFPLLYTGWVSLHAWDLLGGQGKWTGVDNFAFVLQQRQFWIALRNTLSIFLVSAIPPISRALTEAAPTDGAGWVRRSFRITTPPLRPPLIFVITPATIGGLQIFDEPRLYDQNGLGGEDQQWMTMTIYLYKLGWTQLNFGRAAAVAWLLFLVIVAVALINLAITRRIATSEGRTA